MVAHLQPSTGCFKVKHCTSHIETCFGLRTPTDGATCSDKAAECKSAYSPAQAARRFQAEFSANPTMTSKCLGDIINRSHMYLRKPCPRFVCAVLEKLEESSARNRELDMAALPGQAELLRSFGHKVRNDN